MKAALFYAVRGLRRRPRDFLALLSVTAAVMLSLIMLLMWYEAEWRQDVMPDHEENYHIRFYNLTSEEKAYIRAQDWVQASYDLYNENRNSRYAHEFRVRVTWDAVLSSIKYANEIYDLFDLWSREPAVSSYDKNYEHHYNNTVKSWYGATTKNGFTADYFAAYKTRYEIIVRDSYNLSFNTKTNTSYIIRPENVALTSLFSMFLGAAVVIMLAERYRRAFRELGTLRALGFERWQIYAVNLAQTFFTVLCAAPLSAFGSVAVVKLYAAATAGADFGNVYLRMLDSVPVSNILLVLAELLGVSLFGTVFVCFIYRNQTTIDLLTERRAFTVSFVQKTSTRFEDSDGLGVYNLLHLIRTRRTAILNALSVVIMTPLPVIFLFTTVTTFASASTPEGVAMSYYYITQSVMLTLTSVIIIFSTAMYETRGRKREFAIFRSFGASVRELSMLAFPTALLQASAAVLLACVLTTNFMQPPRTTFGVADPVDTAVFFGQFFAAFVGCLAFILGSSVGGTAAGMRGATGANITDNIRELE